MVRPAIEVKNLSKRYRLGEINARSLREAVERLLSRRRGEPRAPDAADFWALKDVSFEVAPGEVLGIIGRNGAGKSTLLKILSRVTEPTEGEIRLRGRVASLLEVGTGFHPELSGRENIFLNGAVLGMTRAEIARKFDEIVDFSGVEKFLDTPVKRYSSGMYVRLAFAVAAHLEPEILIVDEVLAVGDAEFQRKCLGQMKLASREKGRTVLFVSHNMAAIENLCGRCFVLSSGSLISYATAREGIDVYLRQAWVRSAADDRLGRVIRRLRMVGADGRETDTVGVGRPITFVADIETNVPLATPTFSINLTDGFGARICCLSSETQTRGLSPIATKRRFTIDVAEIQLVPGDYQVEVVLWNNGSEVETVIASVLQVIGTDYFGTGRMPDRALNGTFVQRAEWKSQ